MPPRERQARRNVGDDRGGASAKRIFGTMAGAGARAYRRERDLPRLIALWPREIEDESPEGSLRILTMLRRALRAERRRGLAGHWSYDLNRHLGLLSAYRAELARAGSPRSKSQPNRTRWGNGLDCG